MLNNNIIFVNGFQRGGTNILVNLLASHPNVQWVKETHQVFHGDNGISRSQKWVRLASYLPLLLTSRQNVFALNGLEDRKSLSKANARYLDRVLNRFAQKSINDEYYNENVAGAKIAPDKIRPLYKNVNGVVLTSQLLYNMYPQAVFIGLVRNGLALCEGFIRRGWTAQRFGQMYARVTRQMIEDSEHLPCYHILRFEDILNNPDETIKKVYSWAGLEVSPDMKFRLQSKKSMGKDGQRSYLFGGEKDREIHWFTTRELNTHLRADVNENQIAQLNEYDKQVCLDHIRDAMQYFNYL